MSKTEIKELIQAYVEYIELLGEELKSMSGLVVAHGWKSKLVEKGEVCRKNIAYLEHKLIEIIE